MNRNLRKGFKEIFCRPKEKKARGKSSVDETDNSGDTKDTQPSDISLADVQVITKNN